MKPVGAQQRALPLLQIHSWPIGSKSYLKEANNRLKKKKKKKGIFQFYQFYDKSLIFVCIADRLIWARFG